MLDELAGLLEVLCGELAAAAVPPVLGEERARLSRAGAGSCGDKRVTRTLKGSAGPLVHHGHERASDAEQQLRELGVVVGGEVYCRLVEADGCGRGVERERAVSRVPEDHTRSLHEARRLRTRGRGELECRDVVMREQLCMVLGPSERFDPFGCQTVLLRAVGAWDLAVGDIAYEDVPERVLLLPRNGRPRFPSQELLPLERVQGLFEPVTLGPVHGGERPE